jgi:hypothetical protein
VAKGRGLVRLSKGSSCIVGVFLVVVVGLEGRGLCRGFCGFVLACCFFFLGVPFVYFLCT